MGVLEVWGPSSKGGGGRCSGLFTVLKMGEVTAKFENESVGSRKGDLVCWTKSDIASYHSIAIAQEGNR